ncbi:MAG: hypothetical protein ABIN67_13025 [Ferruginibacter sp.]
MQENNFEKQVRQKMEELKVNPSAEAWQKVASKIEKKGRDRKMIYFFSILFLILVTSFITWWNSSTVNEKLSTPIANVDTTVTEKETDRQINNASVSDTTILNKKNKLNISRGNETTQKINRKNKEVKNPAVKIVSNEITSVSTKKKPDFNNGKKKENIYSPNPKIKYSRPQKSSITMIAAEPVESDIEEASIKKLEEGIPLETASNKENPIDESLEKIIDKDVLIIKSGQLKYSESILPPPENKYAQLVSNRGFLKEKHKWQFGLNLSGGVSTTRSGYLGIVGSSQLDENKDYSNSIPVTSPGNNTGSTIVYTPSQVKLSSAFVVGMYVQKQVSPNTSFLVGLNYKHYSTKMNLGVRVDSFSNSNLSSSDFYYRSGNTIKYYNRYHFIEMPVGILFNLSKKRSQLPVYLYTGISVSQLINTTALQYEQQSGSYYMNETFFNKTQVGLSARVLFSLFKNSKKPLLVGPDINYSLTKMATTGLYSDRHYSYIGLHLQKTISKK